MRKDDHLIFEALQSRIPGAGPDAALRNTGAGENAEHVPLTLGEPDPALKNTGPGENAEGSIVKEGDFFEADGEKYVCVGVENVDGKTVVHGQMLAEFGDTFPIKDIVKID